ncbi:MAG TPA: thiamine ABC transporter substrate-binding protein [Nocardioides sp.]|nr:thiamine ABC transporter substrate-binding protein [Nocardioides sp.]
MRRIHVLVPALLLVAGCSTIGEDSGGGGAPSSDRVVLITHDSFSLPKPLIKKFEDESGYDLVVRGSGDAGVLTNKLVLTKDDPLGDVSFGVDNTFASRALDAGVFAPYDAPLPDGADQYRLPGDDDHDLTPIDNGNVCVNVDDTWFAAHHLAPPRTLDDLVDPAYRDLFVTPGAATSSPGMAFLLTTIAKYGEDGWQDWWATLLANGAKLVDGWSQAYEVDFTQGGGKGDRPIVLSYDSSPAFTVSGGKSSTSALLDTCFRQVEYAGVLAGAQNPKGAEALVDFLLTPEVQAALPESMYVFPVDASVPLPTEWAKFAKQPTDPYAVDPADISAHRDEWLRAWSDVTSR